MKGRAVLQAMFLLLTLAPPVIMAVPAGQPAPSLERSFLLPERPNVLLNDTDADGLPEILCFGRGFLRVLDTPSYSEVLSLNGSGEFQPLLREASGSGRVEIVVEERLGAGLNCTIFSGSDFSELWRYSDADAKELDVADIDADGDSELVFLRVLDSPGGAEALVRAYGGPDHEIEWESSPVSLQGATGARLWCIELDGDPALEILLVLENNASDPYSVAGLQLWDARSREALWRLEGGGGLRYALPHGGAGDLDGDGDMELLVLWMAGETNSGLLMLSGATGDVEWNRTLAGACVDAFIDNVNGDGGMELVVGMRGGGGSGEVELMFEVFDLSARELLWSAGPVPGGAGLSEFLAEDLDCDGDAELLFLNTTAGEGGFPLRKLQVLDGRTFEVLWTSPEVGGFGHIPYTARLDEGEAPVLILESWEREAGRDSNGSVLLYSTADFHELWRSGLFPGAVHARAMDLVGDSRKELVVEADGQGSPRKRAYVFDTRSFELSWTSPAYDGHLLYGGLRAEDLSGGPERELIFVGETWGTKIVDGAIVSQIRSNVSVYDGGWRELWSSGVIEGGVEILAVEDFDSDSRMEALLMMCSEEPPYWRWGLAVWEFPREPGWPQGLDSARPLVGILRPAQGAAVSGPVDIAGWARDDVAVLSVEVRVDNGPWVPASLRPSAGAPSCEWEFLWNASGAAPGPHRISARAGDGIGWSPEETVEVRVRGPQPPATTVSPFPALLCAAILAVAALLAALLARRRAGRAESGDGPPPPPNP
ncbi:MAG: Ig-like domain-containing protein [Thermoplasmata archaeon]